MKAFVRILCILSLTVFCGACGGGSGGGGTTIVSTAPRPPPPDPLTDGNYTVFQLDPIPGHSRANANDINDNGQSVGWSAGQEQQTAVLWTIDAAGAVTVQNLGMLPGGTYSIAHGINNLGQVVGVTDGALGSRFRPFIWTAGDGMRDLGVPEGLVGGLPRSINDAGQVVGTFITSETNATIQETFGIWIVDETGATTEERNLGNLGGKNAIAFDNNVHGNVVGDIFFERVGSGTSQTGFFWSEAGGVIGIGTEEALGINDFDEVVGVRSTSGDDAYVWTAAGGLTEIPGGIASAINNSGQVTGRPNGGGRRGYGRTARGNFSRCTKTGISAGVCQ